MCVYATSSMTKTTSAHDQAQHVNSGSTSRPGTNTATASMWNCLRTAVVTTGRIGADVDAVFRESPEVAGVCCVARILWVRERDHWALIVCEEDQDGFYFQLSYSSIISFNNSNPWNKACFYYYQHYVALTCFGSLPADGILVLRHPVCGEGIGHWGRQTAQQATS